MIARIVLLAALIFAALVLLDRLTGLTGWQASVAGAAVAFIVIAAMNIVWKRATGEPFLQRVRRRG